MQKPHVPTLTGVIVLILLAFVVYHLCWGKKG